MTTGLSTLGEHFPDPGKKPDEVPPPEEPVIMLGDTTTSETTPPAGAGNTPAETSLEKETSEKPRAAKAGEDPDYGKGEHLAVQGLITFKSGLLEFVLAPRQMLPFSVGYEFLGQAYRLRYHRGVYTVGLNGNPTHRRHPRQIEFAKGAYGYVTPADSIVGFSGIKYQKSMPTLEAVNRVHDLFTRLDEHDKPWAATTTNLRTTVDEILPQFWVELADPVHPAAPLETMLDLSTGKMIKVVRLRDWHLLAPAPGAVKKDHVDACCREHGLRFILNRIYISGTGFRQVIDDPLDEPLEMAKLGELESPLKLKTVLLPCVDSKMGKTDGGLHDLFSSPSASALRNLLGDQVIPGNSVFA